MMIWVIIESTKTPKADLRLPKLSLTLSGEIGDMATSWDQPTGVKKPHLGGMRFLKCLHHDRCMKAATGPVQLVAKNTSMRRDKAT